MKAGHTCSFIFLLIGLDSSVGSAQSLTPTQAREDINFLKRKFDLLHPAMGCYTPLPRREQLYDSLYTTLNTPIDYATFFRHITPLFSALKDGHTNLNHRKNYTDKNTRYVPFFIRLVDSRYFITHNVSADTSLQRGTELFTINSRSIADLHQELMNADHLGSDGNNLTGRRQWSLIQFADYYVARFGSVDSMTITYRLRGDTLIRKGRLQCPTLRQFRTAMLCRYGSEINKFAQQPNLSVRIVDTHTAVLRVSSFMSLRKKDPFQWTYNRKLKQVFRQIRSENVQNLIVDLQGNGGGLVMNSAQLLRYWMWEPFRMMENETMQRAARAELITSWDPVSALNFSFQYKADKSGGFSSRSSHHRYHPVRKNEFKGNLYFLMNGASFSASITVLAKTLYAGLGTFIGEASSSAYWGDFAGHFKTITLPNSRLQVRIPLKKMTHAVRIDRANGFTVEPDFVIARSYEDLLTNRDYVLDYTLQLIRKGIVACEPEQ